jgi:hypothetical protein
MASTRNKNTPGDYALEKNAYNKMHSEIMYTHAAQGEAYRTNLPGNGLLPGRIAACNLSKNNCDVESFLFGIGSTNLEITQEPPKIEIYTLPSLHMIQSVPMVMPKPLGIEGNQRPMYLN